MPITRSLVCGLLLSLAACALSAAASPAPTPIRTAGDLQQHLADADTRSPLDAMPLGARQRFLASLSFGIEGVGGFSSADLNDTLTSEQILALLALFELESYAGMLEGLPHQRAPREFLSPFEHRFDAFDAVASNNDTHAVVDAYQVLLAGSDPAVLAQSLDAYDRALLYRAMLRVLEVDGPAAIAHDARQLLDAMRSAGEATRTQVRYLFDALVMQRDFDAAGKLAGVFPEATLPALPSYTLPTAQREGNAALLISPDGTQMNRVAVDIERGLQILVVAGCHFAHDAALAIAADPALDRLFNEHSTWLAPSGQSLAAAADWNREFPQRPILIAWTTADWPQVTSWAMPTFLVFRDGVLLRSWSGWPADTGMATLRAELAAAGIASEAPPRTDAHVGGNARP
jgi:hypothetical protein